MEKILCLFVVLLLYFNICCSNDNDEKSDQIFIATNEWQSIKKGQQVPAGLHYRINLQTGATEAKLLVHENEKRDLITVSENTKENPSGEELKQALKGIKVRHKKSKAKKSKLHITEEIKNETQISTHFKYFLKLHNSELQKDEIEEKHIFFFIDNLEYLTEEYNLESEIIDWNIFPKFLYRNLNITSDKIRTKTLVLFGSLVQNNGKLQLHALETGAVEILLRLLTLNPSEILKTDTIFSLSCLLRGFPLAQQKFVEHGGVPVILKTFEESNIKVRLKLVMLMSDLFLEKRQAEDQNIVEQYRQVDLERNIMQQNWCVYINQVLEDIIKTSPNDHDSIEKVLAALTVVINECKSVKKSVLQNLRDIYIHLSKDDANDDDNFYRHIFVLCDNILKNYNKKTEL